MGVATAFAVSWSPFVKSKNRATAMTSATTGSIFTAVEFTDADRPGNRIILRLRIAR